MKDKELRKALGMHGPESDLCGCDVNPTNQNWQGEIPMLWRKVHELEAKVKQLEKEKEVVPVQHKRPEELPNVEVECKMFSVK